jgi:hypothetical protein
MAPPKRPKRSAESADEQNPSDAGAGEAQGPAAFPLPVIPTDTPSRLPRQRHEHPEK